MTPLRSWQAQKFFGTATNEVKAPEVIAVAPQKDSFKISWKRRLGMVDGFIVLVGTSPNELRDRETVPFEEKMEYSVEVGSLDNGREYFTTVVAFRGDVRSNITELWKVVPNFPVRCRPAERVDAGHISAYPHPPTTDSQSAETQTANARPSAGVQPATASQNSLAQPAASQTPAVQPAREEPVQPPAANASAAEPPRRRPEDIAAICGGCSGDVILDANLHLYVCSGCGARYVQRTGDGKFLPVDILVNGICECCDPRRPLVQPSGEPYKKCSRSGEQYVELPGNGLKRVSQLDYGLCSCCQPAAALILNAQGQVVCSRNRERLYIREGNRFIERVPEARPSLLTEIDRALSDGSAGILPNGILVTGNEQPRSRRGRRRNNQ